MKEIKKKLSGGEQHKMKRRTRIVCAIIFTMFGSLLCGIGADFSKSTFGMPGTASIIIGIIFGFSLIDC